MSFAILWTVACHKRPPEEVPIPAVPAPATAPTVPAGDPRDDLVQALSLHDGEPDCAAIEAGLAEPVPMLLSVVAEVRMPPVAPMRAAACVLALHGADPAVADAVAAWVVGPETRGLALLVGQQLDTLPPEVAVRAATAAHAGPWSADLAPAVLASIHPEVRAVFGGP